MHKIWNNYSSKKWTEITKYKFNKDDIDTLPYINLTDKSVSKGAIDYDIVIKRQNFSTDII